MGGKQQNERINWLSATLETQRNNISNLLLRLRGIAFRVGGSLSIHKKFMRLMDQVAIDREKEIDIIHEIEDVEKQHLFLKQHNLLRHADIKAEEKRQRDLKKKEEQKDREDKADEEEGPSRVGFSEILAMFWLFSSDSGVLSRFNFFSKNKMLSGEPMPQPTAAKHDPTVE